MPLPVAGERLAQPPSPENCTIREESRTTVRVSCAESEYFDANTATYVLQVFDADTRRLLASATSLTPSMLEVTNLPAERSQSGLVLSLRIMTAHAMSDATVLHSPHFVQEGNTNKEHHRYPGRAQIHNGSSYQSARTPVCPLPRLTVPMMVLLREDSSGRCDRCRASYENRLRIYSLPLVQFELFFSRPVTSWRRVLSRPRDSEANDSYSRVIHSSVSRVYTRSTIRLNLPTTVSNTPEFLYRTNYAYQIDMKIVMQ